MKKPVTIARRFLLRLCVGIFTGVLGLLSLGCQTKAYLELKNSTGRDFTVRINHAYGAQYYSETMELANGETQTKEILMKGANREPSVSAMEYLLYEDGKSTAFAQGLFTENITEKVEVVSILTAAPDPKLVGKWQRTSDGQTLEFFNSNKCKLTPSKPYVAVHDDYDFEQWKVESNKIYFLPWEEIDTAADLAKGNYPWNAREYSLVSSDVLRINSIGRPSDYSDYSRIK